MPPDFGAYCIDFSRIPGYVDSGSGGMWQIRPTVLRDELFNNPGVEDRRYFLVSDIVELLRQNGIEIVYEKQSQNPS